MKKLLTIIMILLLTFVLSGCDFTKEVKCIDENKEEFDCSLIVTQDEVYTKAEVNLIVEQAIMEAQIDMGFPIEPTEDQWENLIKDNVDKEDLIEALYDVINQAVTDEELIDLVDDVLHDNGFYEEYDDVVYDYIENFWEEFLLQVFEEALAESEGSTDE